MCRHAEAFSCPLHIASCEEDFLLDTTEERKSVGFQRDENGDSLRCAHGSARSICMRKRRKDQGMTHIKNRPRRRLEAP